MTREKLMDAALACLGNNMMFDAAMAAIASTVLNSARENNEALRDPANYRIAPVQSIDVNVRHMFVASRLSIDDIHFQVAHLEDLVITTWLRILKGEPRFADEKPERVLWNTVRIALHPVAPTQWDVYLVYMATTKE